MMEAMLSFLRRQLGLRTDAADATGSLHAKVKEARDTIVNTELPKYQKPRGGIKGSGSTTSTTYVTLLSVTGRGRIVKVVFWQTNSSYVAYIQITIDGSSFGELSTSSTSGIEVSPIFGGTDVCFQQSLVIQGKVTGGSLGASWVYEKE